MKVVSQRAPLSIEVVEQPASAKAEQPTVAKTAPAAVDAFVGAAVKELALKGPVTDPTVQISGMAWHGENLLLMPQFAQHLYVLAKNDVLSHLDGGSNELTPSELPVGPKGYEAKFDGFQGFEAMAVVGDRVYLLAEASIGDTMLGYLVAAKLTPEGLQLELDNIQTLPCDTRINNMGYEALTVVGDRLIAWPEVNGATTNTTHVARSFDLKLQPLDDVPLPTIEHRLTDSTPADADGRFWVANYNHPGDHGMPEAPIVEQLIPMRSADGRVQQDGDPIELLLQDGHPGRNWEAVAKLDDRGFLVMNDEFPRPMLAFVPKR